MVGGTAQKPSDVLRENSLSAIDRLSAEIERNLALEKQQFTVTTSQIGEKGLGFKSLVQNSSGGVSIFSRGFQFRLRPSTAEDRAGPFVPRWLEVSELPNDR